MGWLDVYKTLQGDTPDAITEGIHVVQCLAAEPYEVQFKILGTELSVDAGLFTIPVSCYPICKGDQFIAYPLVGEEHQRLAIIAKLNGSGRTGTMLDLNSCSIDGVAVPYKKPKIVPYSGASAGDRVAVYPYGTQDDVKYILIPLDGTA